MRQTFCTLVLVAVVVNVGLSAQADVSGRWEITLNTQVESSTWNATFEQNGSSLSGEIDMGGRELFSLKGMVDGSTIKFEFIVPDLDGDLPITLTGSVSSDGESIVGENGSFIWYGAGSWTATKQAS